MIVTMIVSISIINNSNPDLSIFLDLCFIATRYLQIDSTKLACQLLFYLSNASILQKNLYY